jgi:hypothetical protein
MKEESELDVPKNSEKVLPAGVTVEKVLGWWSVWHRTDHYGTRSVGLRYT